jgi:hypothetical protein
MKYINFILYILLLLILITLFYNCMLKEHFIESVTEICNTRKKLNLENCFKDIRGDTGTNGVIGRSGRIGQVGDQGDKGIPGANGLDAKFIGTVNFRDILTNKILGTSKEHNSREIDNKVTNIKLLRGDNGDNARMNPIIFKDSETQLVISQQYMENYDLNPIVVEIQKGNKGIRGKDAICEIPGRRGIKGPQGHDGDKGIKGDIGNEGRVADVGDVIENPEFDLILTDELCTNGICMNLDMFKGIYTHIHKLGELVEQEQMYQDAITAIADTAATEENKCPSNTQEQFTNFEDMKCHNSDYCPKIINGDKGDDGKRGKVGFDGFKGEEGERGIKGHDGINGEEIPNIVFYDKNSVSLIGMYNSVDKNAETKKIHLKNGVKGDSGYIPNIIFKYNNETITTHDKEVTNKSNKDIDDIIVYLDNSKGPHGKEGIDGVCEIGSEGPQGEEGEKGHIGDPGERGYDGDEGEKGDPGPQDNNPSYIKVTANKYCFSNGILSDICLDDILLSKLINSKKE